MTRRIGDRGLDRGPRKPKGYEPVPTGPKPRQATAWCFLCSQPHGHADCRECRR